MVNNLTLEEVRELASSPSSCIRQTEANIVILLHPRYAGNAAEGVNAELCSRSSRYCRDLGGIPMAFEKVRISSDGGVFHTNPFIHLRVHATFYVFSPEVGSILEGTVKRKSPNHLSCLVHKTFNVSVPKPHNSQAKSWEGASVEEGEAVRLVLSEVNMTFDLPMIKGQLDGRIGTAACKSGESTEAKPSMASVDSGISSDHDDDREKKIKKEKKKEKKSKKKKIKEGEEGDMIKKEKKKKKKEDKEKRKKDKKNKKETSEEKKARKEKKKKKDKEKKEKKNKKILEGDRVAGDNAISIKIEPNMSMHNEDYSTHTVKTEMASPAKHGAPKGCVNSEKATEPILNKQIKVEVCSQMAHNMPSASNVNVGADICDFDDDDFFGNKTTSKKRKLEESPAKSKKKPKLES